jgi:hypothetical protein
MTEGTTEERIDRMRDATAEHRCALMARNLIANLRHAAGRHVDDLAINVQHGALVVGAGPISMSRLRNTGARVVYATQSSALALAHVGKRADYIVCIESIDVSEQLRKATDANPSATVILDLTAHPKCFEAAERRPVIWSLAWSAYYGAIYDCFDVRPLSGGGAAFTTAVAFALRRHLDVHLVGFEGVVDGKGATYAPGSPWSGLRHELDEATGEVRFEGHPERDELHRASGVPPIPRTRRLIRSSDGRWIKPEVMTQCLALSAMREQYPGVRMTTDPVAAAELTWERRSTSEAVFAACAVHKYAPASRRNAGPVADAHREILQQAERQLHYAQRFEVGGALLVDGPTIPSMLAAPDLIMARRSGLSLRDRLRVQYAAYAEAARLAKRLLSAT